MNHSRTSLESGPPPAPVTLVLILVNFAVFFWEAHLSVFRRLVVTNRYALSLDGVQAGMWWQFFSFQFLHGGWLHLFLNLMFLHSIGPVLEATIGARRYLSLYLVSGAVGGLAHVAVAWLSPGHFGAPVVGASAGLCGLLAATCALYAEETVDVRLFFLIPLRLRAKFLLLGVALVSIGGAIFPFGNVAHLAHLGGLVGGLLCLNFMKVTPLVPPELPPEETRR